MKELKNLLNQETVEQARSAAEKIAETIPEEALDEVAGAGNPFDKIPRVPTQPIDDDLRENA